MWALPIVEHFLVVEIAELWLRSRLVAPDVNQFALECFEEVFIHSIVPAVALAAQAQLTPPDPEVISESFPGLVASLFGFFVLKFLLNRFFFTGSLRSDSVIRLNFSLRLATMPYSFIKSSTVLWLMTMTFLRNSCRPSSRGFSPLSFHK